MTHHSVVKYHFRPLMIASAVGFICQNTLAQSTPSINDTPFANRPLHLQSESKTTSAGGVKPNVMLFLDDSGSMLENANTGSYRIPELWNTYLGNCTYNQNNLLISRNLLPGNGQQTNPSMGRCLYYYNADIIYYRNKGLPPGPKSFLRPAAQVRMDANINAINEVLTKTGDSVNWHLLTLWGSEFRYLNGGFYNFDNIGKASVGLSAEDARKLVNNMSPIAGTPATERYLKAANVLDHQIKYRCQKNYIVFMSDGEANGGGFPWPGGVYGTQPRWWSQHDSSGPNSGDPGKGVSVFSSKLYNMDMRVGGTDVEGGSWDDPKYPKQNIETITIGYGNGLTPQGRNYLKNAAQPSEGAYFANNASELADAFLKALAKVQTQTPAEAKETSSISTPSVTGSSVADLAAFLTLDTGKWSSELKFYKFSTSGSTAGELLRDGSNNLAPPVPAIYADRRVLVNNGTQKYWLNESDAKKEDFAILSDKEFKDGFVPWLMRSNKTDEQIELDVAGVTPRTVKKYRKRSAQADDPSRQMGDVLDAPTIALGKDQDNRQEFVITAANDGMLYVFQSTRDPARPYGLKLNYLPAGMQRESADDSITVGKAIHAIAEEGYGKDNVNYPHLYLHNGGLTWGLTAETNGLNQQYVVLATMGQGGRGAYGLTIGGKKRLDRNGNTPAGMNAPESDWLNEVPLWETEKGVSNTLGYTVSKGTMAQVATRWNNGEAVRNDGVHYYAFVANGYKAKNAAVSYESPTLYIYDMLGQEFGTDTTRTSGNISNGNTPGKRIKKISVGGAEGALSSPTVVDVDFDGVIDIAYAGDQFGNLYRFDFRSDPSGWKVNKMYTGIPTQPITSAPAVYRKDGNKYVVIFGTGSDIFEDDRKDMNQQMIMGIHDDLTQDPVNLLSNDSRIAQQAFTSDNKIRKIEVNNFDPKTHSAWRINLEPGAISTSDGRTVASEKVVSKPQMLLSTAYITSRIYEYKETATALPSGATRGNTCFEENSKVETGGTSWLMSIDVRTGAAPTYSSGTVFKGGAENTAGKNLNSISSQGAMIDANKVAPDIDSRLPNGDHDDGKASSLTPPGEKGTPPRNDCLAKDAKPNIVVANDSKTALQDNPLDGKRCGDPSLFRASEREIQL